jgi:hypothetical protein
MAAIEECNRLMDRFSKAYVFDGVKMEIVWRVGDGKAE